MFVETRHCLVSTMAIFGLLILATPAHAATYYWTGNLSSNPNTALNWKTTNPAVLGCVGDALSAPTAADTVVFDADCDNNATFTADATYTSITMEAGYAGTVSMGGNTFNIDGPATFNGGTLNNGALDIDAATGETVIFDGTTFGVTVDVVAGNIYFSGGTFNSTLTAEKTSASTIVGDGGTTFNGTTSITNSGTAYLRLAGNNPDIFNAQTTFNSTNTAVIYVAYGGAGTEFNENVIVNSTSTGGIFIGGGAGTSTLAATKTITVGGSGFSGGTLHLRGLTQTGATAQSLTLTGSASVDFEDNTVFNGNLTVTAPNIYFDGSTFNGTATFDKTSVSNIISDGGSTFNGTTSITNSGTGYLRLGSASADVFNAQTTLNSTNSGVLYVAYGAAGTQFNENVIVNSTSTGGTYIGGGAGTSTLAATKTITVGGSGFSGGLLQLRGFTQTGATAQSLTLTGSASIDFEDNTVFNGNLTVTAPNIYFDGSTFNGTATFDKTSVSNIISDGGSTFNGTTSITNSGAGYLRMGNASADVFNAQTTLNSTNSGVLYVAYGAAGTQFNENVIVNSTSTAGVYIGGGAGTSTLAATKTITVGGSGFSGGLLQLWGFTQTGATAQSLTLTGSASIDFEDNTVFNGNLTVTAPNMYFEGATFNGTATFDKTSALNIISDGGSTFNGTTSITNSGAGYLRLGNTTADEFNAETTLNSTNTGLLYTAYAAAGTEFNENVIVNSTSTGGIYIGGNGGTSTLAATKTITVGGSGFSGGTLLISGLTQTGATAQSLTLTSTGSLILSTGTTFNGDVTFTAPNLYPQGTTFNGAATLEKTSASNIIATGGSTFNGTTSITNSGTGYLRLNSSAADTYNGNVTFVNSSTGSTHIAHTADANFDANVTANSLVSFGANGGTVVFSEAAGTQTFNSGGVTVPRLTHSGAGTLQLTGNDLTVSTALTNSAGTIDLNGRNLTATGATFSNDGTIRLIGSETITGLTPDTDSGTFLYAGDGDAAADTLDILDLGANDYYNLTINATDGNSEVFELNGALNADGALTITTGTLDTVSGSNYAINVAGNWANSGIFTAQNGTVTLDGGNQTIANTNTFYNLTKNVTAAATLTFPAGLTQTVTNTLNLSGAASQLLTLASSAPGSTWYLNPTGTRTVSYLTPTDSTNPGGTILCTTGCTDGGNTFGWAYTTPANFTWIGAGGDNNWSTGANWQGGTKPGAANAAVFSNVSIKSATVDEAFSILGLTIGSGYSGTITQSPGVLVTVGTSDFTQNGGTYTVGTGGLTLTASDLVINGGTFAPSGGTVTFNGNANTWTPGAETYGDVVFNKTGSHAVTITAAKTADIDGDLTLSDGIMSGTGAIHVAGDLSIGAGFDQGTALPTITLDGAGAQSITGSTGYGPIVAINKSGGTASLASNTSLTGLIVTAGTFDPAGYTLTLNGWSGTWTPGNETYTDVVVNKSSAITLTVTGGTTADVDGDLYLTDGLMSGSTANIRVEGDVTIGAGFDLGTAQPTVTLDGGGAQAINGTNGFGPILEIDKAAGTASLTAATNLTSLIVTDGTFDPAGYTLTFNGWTGTWTPGAETYTDVVVNKSHTVSLTVSAGTTADVDGNLTLSEGYLTGSTGTILVAGDLTIAAAYDLGTAQPTITLDGAGAQAINGSSGYGPILEIEKAAGTASLTADTSLTSLIVTDGTFDPAGYTVTFNGWTGTWAAGSETYADVVVNKSNTVTLALTAGTTADVNGDLTLLEGQVSSTGGINLAGDLSISSAYDLTSGHATVTLDGGGAQTITGASSGYAPAIVINKGGGTASLASDTSLAGLVVTSGTFDPDGHTIYFVGWTGSWTPGAETYGDIVLNKSAGIIQTVTAGTADVDGDLALNEGLLHGPGVVAVSGDVTLASTFDTGTVPLTFDGGANQTLDLTGVTGALNGDITINKSGGQVNLLSALIVDANNQDLTIAEGTLDLNGFNLTESGTGAFVVQDGGNFQLQGGETYTIPTLNSGSTVTFDGTSSIVLPAGITTYYNLTIDEAGTSDPGYTLPDANVAVQGVLTITDGQLLFDGDKNLAVEDGAATGTAVSIGADGEFYNFGTGDLTLHGDVANAGTIVFNSSDDAGDGIAISSNDAGSNRNWQGTGSFSIGDVTVNDQSAIGGAPAEITAVSSTDGSGDNTNWDFGATPAAFTWIGEGGDNNWSTGANWQGGSAPGNSDTAIFDDTSIKDTTIDTNVSVGGIDINSGYTGTITQGGTNTLTIGAAGWTQDDGAFVGGSGTITVSSNVGPMTLNGGSFTSTSGSLTFGSGAALSQAGGTFTHNSGTVTLTGENGTFDVNGTVTLYNLTIAKSDNRNMNLGAGDTAIVTGTLTLTNGEITTGTVEARGAISIASTFDGTENNDSGALVINGAVDQSFVIPSGAALPNFTLNNAATTVSFDAGATVGLDGDLTLTAGTFTAPSGTLAIGNGRDLTITSGVFNHNSGTVSFAGEHGSLDVNTVATFYNITVNKSNNRNVNIGANDTIIVVNTLTLTEGNVATGTVEARGDVTGTAGFDSFTSALTFSGGATQTFTLGAISSINGDITIDKSGGSVNLGADLTVDANNQDLTVAEGTFDLNGFDLTESGTGTFVVEDGGNFQLQGGETFTVPTLNSGSTVTYDSTASIVLPAAMTTYYNLVIDEAGTSDPTFTLPDANVTVQGRLTITDGYLQFDDDKSLVLEDDGATGTALTIDSGGYFYNTGTGDLTLYGNVMNSGIVNFESSDESGNGITIGSNDTNRRNWQGSGDFIFEDVTVDYQDAAGGNPAAVTAWSSTDQGTNQNWLFDTPTREHKHGGFLIFF